MTTAMPVSAVEQARRLVAEERIRDAAAALERHLEAHAADVEALRFLARVLANLGDVVTAERRLDAAAAVDPSARGLEFERGTLALMADRAADAAAAFRRELARDDGNAAAWFNLGWALRRLGDVAAAVAAFRRAVALAPSWQGWFNLGNALLDQGADSDALAALEQARALNPDDAGIAGNLGLALWRGGRVAEAESLLRAAAQAAPGSAASVNLGNLLTATGREEQAAAVYRTALAVQPDNSVLMLNLAIALQQAKRFAEAEQELARLTRLCPDAPEGWNALGRLYLRQDRLGAARDAFARAVELRPDYVEAVNNLGNTAAMGGHSEDALAHYRAAHALAPHDAAVHSNLLFHMTHMAGLDPAEVFAEHRRFGEIQEALAQPLPPLPLPGRDPVPLRVGYVSPDFCNHAVAFWFEGVLAHHDPALVEVFCYHSGPRHDAVTERLKSLVPHWRDINGVSADGAAALVRADGIHILVDLAGHSAHNALPVFVRRPAPVQAAFLGYPGTTGLTRIDYRLHTEPQRLASAQDRYTETLVPLDLPPTFRPPPDAPAVTPLPMARGGAPCFGSFNKPQKIGEPVYDLWAEILRRLPDASLLMMVPDGDEPAVRDRFRAHFTGRGVDGGRVGTVGLRDLGGFLETVSRVDVALDPFPYGGGTTTLMTLWMGVPVIGLYGEGAADGVTTGAMYSVGLSHRVPMDRDAYLDVAVAMVRDVEELAGIRATLRDRMRQSCLTQEAAFTAALERQYLRLWADHAASRQAGDGSCAE